LSDIFEQSQTKVEAKQAIQSWCQRLRKQGIKAFEPFLTTLGNWLDEITNYFLERQTSGFVAGFNNRIKVLKRRCYGIFDVKRTTLDLRGYERFGGSSVKRDTLTQGGARSQKSEVNAPLAPGF
jgi:transposase